MSRVRLNCDQDLEMCRIPNGICIGIRIGIHIGIYISIHIGIHIGISEERMRCIVV